MSFNSLTFLIFLPLVVLIYWILPHKVRWIFLLISSYFFYAFLNFFLISLILTTTLVSYLGGLAIERYPKRKKVFLIFSLVICLGMLFVFKYLDFAIQGVISIANLFGANLFLDPLNLILPVGISFYTFQTLSYVIDVYRGKYRAEKHIGYYALFVSFFPQLVAGPIESPQHLLPQLKQRHYLHFDDFSIGLKFVVSGFIKKIVFADFLGIFVNAVYSNLGLYSGSEIALATFLFAFEIYGDFAGYSEIALGVAKWMGISLIENFKRPYLSSSIKEFWRRWHISLNSWFTEYVYIPLGGSKKGLFRQCMNIMIVFFISGLWHGASVHFVIWGLIHGLYMVIGTLLEKKGWTMKKYLPNKVYAIYSVIKTFLLVCFAWIFFRANTLSDAFLAISKIFTSVGFIASASYFTPFILIILCALFVLLPLLPYLPVIPSYSKKDFFKKPASFALPILIHACLIFTIGIGWSYILGQVGPTGFIYFQF